MRTYAWLPGEIADGRRIVRVDLRGHGGSEHAPSTYDVDHYGEDVVGVLRETVGRPAVLVGHSLGGVVAWWVAQRHPDLVVAAFLEDPPLYMGEPAEHEDNAAVPIFGTILAAVERWKAQGLSVEEAAAELAAGPTAGALCDDVPPARAEALLRMDPGVLEGAIDRSTLAPTDTASQVSVPVFLLAADFMGSAFAAHHAERLAISHPDVEIVRVPGAGHGIHDEREHRGEYVEALADFLATHAYVEFLSALFVIEPRALRRLASGHRTGLSSSLPSVPGRTSPRRAGARANDSTPTTARVLRLGTACPQRLLVDLEVARRGQQRRQVRVGAVHGCRADQPVAAPPVPRLEELLARVLPRAWDEQFELDRSQPALAAPPLGEGEQRPADTAAALIGGGGQQPELARVVRDVMEADGAGDAAVAGGDRDLPGLDQLRELGRRRPRGPVAPEPALGHRVDAVDEVGQLTGESDVAADGRIQHADGDRLVRAHASRMAAGIERGNT
jgi:esterase